MKKSAIKEKKHRIYIGTSGWVYKSWHKALYPKSMKKDFLAYYSYHFQSVEVNSSFYHLPLKSTFKKWKEETPPDFGFSVKMSRYITHIKRLKGVKPAIKRFLTAASGMSPKLEAILIQTPPLLPYDKKRFSRFVKNFDDERKRLRLKARAAFEPRHGSWFSSDNLEEIRKIAKKYDVALVFAHSSVFPIYDPNDPLNLTSDCVYIRFHGPQEFAASKYGTKLLRPWAKRIRDWSKERTVFAYFNDDAHGYAVNDAKSLMKLLNDRPTPKNRALFHVPS